MTRTVHHYYPYGSQNIGDELVAHALRQALPRVLGPLEFVNFPANKTYTGSQALGLRGENLARNNAEADFVLIGGSNLLEPRKPGPENAFRTGQAWGVVTDRPSIAQLEKPLILLGQGTGSSYGQRLPHYLSPAREEIQQLHKKAVVSAVRDYATQRRLAEIGVTTECTGCPVTFLTDRAVTAGDERLPLLVSFPPERMTRYWTGRRFMQSAMDYVSWLQREGVPVIVTLHDRRDREPAQKWVPSGVEIFDPVDIPDLIARFENCRGVVGFRLHAALLGLGLGKPILPVGVDWRGLGFIETFELQDLSIRPFRLGQFSKLKRLTRELLSQPQRVCETLTDAKNFFRQKYERTLTLVASKIDAAQSAAHAA